MDKIISVNIGPQLDGFINSQVVAGRYASANEVVLAGLRLLQEHADELVTLSAELLAGEQSGASARDVREIWLSVKARHGTDGA